MFDRELFGAALVRLRGDRSQRAIARLAKASSASLNRWERGLTTPQALQIPRLLRGLGSSEEELRITMWEIEADRLQQMLGGESLANRLKEIETHQAAIAELIRTNHEIPEPLRPLVLRLRQHFGETVEKLKQAHADLEVLTAALGRGE